MICIIALAVFSVMGVFSATHRRLAGQAFDCVFRRVTLRPCNTGFDERMKGAIVGRVLKRSPLAARLLNRHFEAFSWALIVLTVLSFAGSVWGVYNWWTYGNCNGPNNSGFCPYNVMAGRQMSPKDIPLEGREFRGSGNLTIIEFACFQCPYSKKAEPTVRRLLEEYGGRVRLAYFYFPLPQHLNGQKSAEAAECALRQGMFWEYHDLLFERQDEFNNSISAGEASLRFKQYATELGLNRTQFDRCLDGGEAAGAVNADFGLGNRLGVGRTPTFYIGEKSIQNPNDYEEFRRAIDEEMG